MDNANRNLVIGVMLLVVLGIIGFMLADSNGGQNPLAVPTPGQVQPQSTALPSVSNEMDLVLDEQNSSGQSGTAKLTEEDDKVKVTLNIDSFPEDIAQPAHIHAGACANLGAIIYTLNNVENGKSETVVASSMDRLRSQQPLAINVHKSESDFNTSVACGNLGF